MAQHDYNVANQTFPATRTDLNNLFSAILSMNSGTSAPSTTVAGMLWYDTTNSIIKQRNAADSGWIHLWAIGKQGLIDQNGSTVYAADSVGSDSYAITLTPAITAYATGQVFRFKAGTANTGAASLNVNGLGAVTIKKNYNTDLATGDILANQLVEVIYDGTNFQMLSPAASTAVFTQSYQSSDQTITSGGSLTLAHGLGVKPKLVQYILKCTSANLGYSSGDEYDIGCGNSNNAVNTGLSSVIDATNINIRFGSATAAFCLLNKGSGSGVSNITNSSWVLIVRAYA